MDGNHCLVTQRTGGSVVTYPVLETVLSYKSAVRLVNEASIRVDAQHSSMRRIHRNHCNRNDIHGIRIKIIDHYIGANLLIHIRNVIVRIGNRWIVVRIVLSGIHANVYRGRVAKARYAIVTDCIYKGVQADETAVGYVLVRSVRIQVAQHSVTDIHYRYRVHRDGVSVRIAIVRQHVACHRNILQRVVEVVAGQRRAVFFSDLNVIGISYARIKISNSNGIASAHQSASVFTGGSITPKECVGCRTTVDCQVNASVISAVAANFFCRVHRDCQCIGLRDHKGLSVHTSVEVCHRHTVCAG